MTDRSTPDFWKESDGPRLPRFALMGEFSAGKSTLANMMIGQSPLPVQVVATQLPPVWITYGNAPSAIVDLEGNETPCDLDAIGAIDPEEVAFIRIQCEQEILKRCEIIDMPGISDPNMASIVWERIMPLADGVLWCSPATQAWRQSEAAVWSEIDEQVRENSLLILTRGDMLLTERDKAKVMKRVKAEAGDMFCDVLMISLALAREAGEDEELWASSGADAFVARFLELVQKLSPKNQDEDPEDLAGYARSEDFAAESVPEAGVMPRRPVSRRPALPAGEEVTSISADPMSFMPKFS